MFEKGGLFESNFLQRKDHFEIVSQKFKTDLKLIRFQSISLKLYKKDYKVVVFL